MNRRCLLLEYVPLNRGKPKPALAVWKGSAKTEVLGLGVEPGAEFDPFPFVGAFPGDSADVWVFAEWAYVTAAMAEEGASLSEVEAWVREDATAMSVSGEPTPTSRKALEERFDTDWMATRPAVLHALAFLAEESTSARVQMGVDVRLTDTNGTTVAVLEVKRTSPLKAGPRLVARLQGPTGEPEVVELAQKRASDRIRAWLRALE